MKRFFIGFYFGFILAPTIAIANESSQYQRLPMFESYGLKLYAFVPVAYWGYGRRLGIFDIEMRGGLSIPGLAGELSAFAHIPDQEQFAIGASCMYMYTLGTISGCSGEISYTISNASSWGVPGVSVGLGVARIFYAGESNKAKSYEYILPILSFEKKLY